jgi:hypothetical protein
LISSEDNDSFNFDKLCDDLNGLGELLDDDEEYEGEDGNERSFVVLNFNAFILLLLL